MKSKFFLTTFLMVLCFGFASFLMAQSAHTTDNTKNTPDQTLRSNARINPSTLALEFSIPIANFTGRNGLTMPLVFNYSSKLWRFDLQGYGATETVNFTTNIPRYSEKSAAGWTSSFGIAQIESFEDVYDCAGNSLGEAQNHVPPLQVPPGGDIPAGYCGTSIFYINRLRIKLPDGATQELRKDDAAHNYDTEPVDWTGTYLATDGSRSRMELASNGGILYLPDGGKYYFGSDHIGYLYEDRNGNRLSFNHSTRTWTDTLGRSLTSPLPLNLASQEQTSGTQNFTMPGLTTGSNRNYQLVWKNLGDSGVLLDANEQLAYAGNQTCPNISYTVTGLFIGTLETRLCKDSYEFNPVVLREIVLPDGSKYKFQYNKYGEITKIEYPTGASERFEYAVIPTLAYKRDYVQDQSNRGVINRWVKESASATELYWKYEAFKQTNGIRIKTTAPDNQTITEQIVETNWANDFPNPKTKWGFDNPMAGRAFDEKLYSGTTLKSRKLTEYEYTQGTGIATRDARVKREISVIFEPNETNALVTMTANTYDISGSSDLRNFSSLNIKSSVNYHFIVVPKTDATTETVAQLAARFNNITPATKTEIDYFYDTNSNYLSATRSILGMVTEQRIINPANNAVVSKSQMRYDEYSFETSGTLPTYASSTWQNPNHNYRGNVTSVRSYTDVANNQYIETHSYFDQYGNVRKAVDGNGNISQIEYNANDYACAYPTLTKTPKPDINGVYGSNTELTTQATYDFNTGLPLTSTDANNQTTTMEYADVLLRPTRIVAPNGHQTISEYGTPDVNGQLPATQRFIKVKTQIDATNWKEGYSWFDGLGRTFKSQSVDSSGDVFTETEYDTMSRPKKATNPYRTGDTKLWTETTFDQFGRVWKVTSPDNAVVETIYGLATTSGSQIGTVTTVKDQALKERRSITNALGQLLRVDEPNDSNQLGAINAPNQPTTYAYDILNNLVQVQQIGTNLQQCGGTVSTCTQTRSFVYDSIARLKSATNPESGTINYGYDAKGNLTSKTDALGITTNYFYDALNRIKTRNYSDGITPNVTYKYDNLANAKGKLIEIDNTISKTKYLSFDTMSRLTSSQQITDGTTYNPMTYVYNLSGALIEETYPSGRVVRNTLDTDGDLMQVQSRKSNDTFKNYANSFNYTASGAVSSMRLGNGRWENTQFNSRLQPTQIGLGSSAANQSLLKLNYDYGTTDNNGNIKSQTITVPNVGNNQGFTTVQNYTYDSLNRLKQADEKPLGYTQTQCDQNPTYCWKQTFQYDRYGNRRFDQANTTFPTFANTNITNPTIDPTNNRFTTGQGYTYDLNGNLLSDAEGKSFVYDAENKQKSASASGGVIGQYYYDGDGKRVKKYVPNTGEITIFLYDASDKMVAEYSTIVEPQATAKISYLTTDHLGSPRIITDQNGAVVSRRDFMPFGEEISSAQRTSGLNYTADNIREKFATYERDVEIDLDYAKNRYFDSGFGRFSSPDPALESAVINSPQSWNRYVYVENNPLKFIDPLGLWKVRFITQNGKTYYTFFKTQDKDNAESLLEQLGFDPKNKDDKKGQAILKAISDNIVEGSKGEKAVSLSAIGNALKGGVSEKYGNFLSIVGEKMEAQYEHSKAGNKKGPEDDEYYDCALTTSKLAFPEEMKNKNKSNFDIDNADALVTDFAKALPNISENALQMLDVVRYGSGDNLHFGNVLFKDDDGNVNVFSRLGKNGPFDVHPINDKKVTKTYGSVSGRFRPRN